jgi:hypothetical protein
MEETHDKRALDSEAKIFSMTAFLGFLTVLLPGIAWRCVTLQRWIGWFAIAFEMACIVEYKTAKYSGSRVETVY